jgi:diguanylate cyclase (GGDEF)-like protein/putative nucleotidyltransferase with HDIG domain
MQQPDPVEPAIPISARPRSLRRLRGDRRAQYALISCLSAVGVMAYFVATRVVSPSGTGATVLGDLVYPQAEALAALGLLWAGRRASGPTRAFFWWMALSTAFGLCGDVTWAVLVMVRHEPPSPSLADAFYLASILAVFPGLYRQFGSPLRRSCELLDSSMVILLIAYLGFSYVLRPQLAGGVSWEAAVTECQTALMLVAGGWAILVPLTVEVRPPLGVRLVSLAVAVQATSWLVYTYALVVRGVGDGSWIYTGWQASWAMMIAGAAAIVLGIGRGSVRRHLLSSRPWVATTGLAGLIAIAVLNSGVLQIAPTEVVVAITGVVILVARLHLTVREQGRLADQMHTLAETDVLTGMANRRVFERRLQRLASEALRYDRPVGMLVIDVDRFKLVNDGYGHPVGDEVLCQLAARIAASIRPSDTLARLGGEEFGVLAPGMVPESLAELAERCRHAVAVRPILVDGVPIHVTVSVGGACIPGHALHADELERLADRSLYNAKEAGRDRVYVGGRSAPQRRIPVSETGIVAQLEVLADRLDGAQSSQEHSLAMVDVAHRLCNALGVSVAQRRRCLAAARLHDIGKIGTPSHILTKPGSLNAAEVAVMQDHVRVGVELLNALPETQEFAAIVAQHHERFDGTGYPAGLAGELISIEARIIAVADAWTAMLADRPYRPALSPAVAREELLQGAGSQFDPVVIAALIDLLDREALRAA